MIMGCAFCCNFKIVSLNNIFLISNIEQGMWWVQENWKYINTRWYGEDNIIGLLVKIEGMFFLPSVFLSIRRWSHSLLESILHSPWKYLFFTFLGSSPIKIVLDGESQKLNGWCLLDRWITLEMNIGILLVVELSYGSGEKLKWRRIKNYPWSSSKDQH